MLGTNGSWTPLAAAPAAPPLRQHGLLFADERTLSRKAAGSWAAAEWRLSAAAALLGLLIFLLSTVYYSHISQATGQLLGGILFVSGAAGVWGGRRRSSSMVNLHLLGCLLGTLLAFSLVSEVVRDTQVDCALAELYVASRQTQAAVAGVAQAEAMQSVMLRLNELEDSLTWVQVGAARQVELHQEQQKLKMNDVNYIRAKLDLVRAHAEQLQSSVVNNPNVTVDHIQRMSEEERAVLRERLETADRVIDRIVQHHAGGDEGSEITFEEYQELLASLTAAGGAPNSALQQAAAELPNFKAALERSKADVYGQLQVGSAPRQLAAIQEQRRLQRERWNREFEATLAKQQARGGDFVASLPEHCVKETAGERVMVAASLAAIMLQLASAYVALSLSVRLPLSGAKGE
ncbi:hypothetical protein ABPG77_000861 [Micractinium sp. CCAP 211/92]